MPCPGVHLEFVVTVAGPLPSAGGSSPPPEPERFSCAGGKISREAAKKRPSFGRLPRPGSFTGWWISSEFRNPWFFAASRLRVRIPAHLYRIVPAEGRRPTSMTNSRCTPAPESGVPAGLLTGEVQPRIARMNAEGTGLRPTNGGTGGPPVLVSGVGTGLPCDGSARSVVTAAGRKWGNGSRLHAATPLGARGTRDGLNLETEI